MQEEIFGPVCPIITYRTLDEAIAFVHTFEKPLACYVFAEDKAVQRRVLTEISSGGACVNDVVIHLATSEMGFSGVGESGMGAYHGRAGFEAFTHRKSIVDKKTWLDLPMRYQPYGKLTRRLLRIFLR